MGDSEATNDYQALATRCFDMMLRDRRSRESFCDWISWWDAQENRSQLIAEVVAILNGERDFEPDEARFYQWPKSSFAPAELGDIGAWTYRRMVLLSNRDCLLRYCVLLKLHEALLDKLADSSFANVVDPDNARHLLYDYPHQIIKWRNWQVNETSKYGDEAVAIVTDLSSFYDTIGHKELVRTISRISGIPVDDSLLTLLKKMMDPLLGRCEFNTNLSTPQHQGLATGCTPDAVFANYYLSEIDSKMCAIKGISYARYCDDINIIGGNLKSVVEANEQFLAALQAKALAINSKKTAIRRGPDAVQEIFDRQHTSRYYYDLPHPSEDTDLLEPMDLAASFEDYSTRFDADDKNSIQKDPRGFCKFMAQSSRDNILLPLENRTEAHTRRLAEIIERGYKSAKWAAWLLVQTSFHGKISKEAREGARSTIISLLNREKTPEIPWIRLVHHLVAPRQQSSWVSVLVDAGHKQALLSAADSRLEHARWPIKRTALALKHAIRTQPTKPA